MFSMIDWIVRIIKNGSVKLKIFYNFRFIRVIVRNSDKEIVFKIFIVFVFILCSLVILSRLVIKILINRV